MNDSISNEEKTEIFVNTDQSHCLSGFKIPVWRLLDMFTGEIFHLLVELQIDILQGIKTTHKVCFTIFCRNIFGN